MQRTSLDPDRAAALRKRLARPWRLLETGPAGGAWNMAVDAALLESAAREATPPTLRFYTWAPPAVSLGRFQSPEGIDLEAARRRGWDVVRRPTGGRAVLHQHELTYSVVLPPSAVGEAGVRTSYAVLIGALHAGLRRLLGRAPEGASCPEAPLCGSPPLPPAARTDPPANCFSRADACDTQVAGGKLVGSAQVRWGGALLLHGSILRDADRAAWSALFGAPGSLVTLRDLLGEAPAPARVAAAVAAGFAELGARLEPGALSPAELADARAALSRFRLP